MLEFYILYAMELIKMNKHHSLNLSMQVMLDSWMILMCREFPRYFKI